MWLRKRKLGYKLNGWNREPIPMGSKICFILKLFPHNIKTDRGNDLFHGSIPVFTLRNWHKTVRISSSLARIKTRHLPIKAKSITAGPSSSVRPTETATCVANYWSIAKKITLTYFYNIYNPLQCPQLWHRLYKSVQLYYKPTTSMVGFPKQTILHFLETDCYRRNTFLL